MEPPLRKLKSRTSRSTASGCCSTTKNCWCRSRSSRGSGRRPSGNCRRWNGPAKTTCTGLNSTLIFRLSQFEIHRRFPSSRKRRANLGEPHCLRQPLTRTLCGVFLKSFMVTWRQLWRKATRAGCGGTRRHCACQRNDSGRSRRRARPGKSLQGAIADVGRHSAGPSGAMRMIEQLSLENRYD